MACRPANSRIAKTHIQVFVAAFIGRYVLAWYGTVWTVLEAGSVIKSRCTRIEGCFIDILDEQRLAFGPVARNIQEAHSVQYCIVHLSMNQHRLGGGVDSTGNASKAAAAVLQARRGHHAFFRRKFVRTGNRYRGKTVWRRGG